MMNMNAKLIEVLLLRITDLEITHTAEKVELLDINKKLRDENFKLRNKVDPKRGWEVVTPAKRGRPKGSKNKVRK